MNFFKMMSRLQAPDDESGGGGGGGGDEPVLNGGTPPANPPATPPGTPPATPPAKVEFPQNWKDGLPDELKSEAALNVIHDIPSLAKSFIHAQKAVGANKVIIPSKHATPEEMTEFFQKIGVPKELSEYGLEIPKDKGFDEEFGNAFKEAAHKAGLLPTQAQKLMDWFGEANAQKIGALKGEQTMKQEGAMRELRTEWGQAFDKNVQAANLALSHHDPKNEVVNLLKEHGLQSNPTLLRYFSKIGEGLAEGTFKGDGKSGPMTPAEATKAINDIFADSKHAYFDRSHPGHKAAVEEVQKLNSFRFST